MRPSTYHVSRDEFSKWLTTQPNWFNHGSLDHVA